MFQNEKRKMLIEQESEKIKQHDESYQQELSKWKANLRPRKQVNITPRRLCHLRLVRFLG